MPKAEMTYLNACDAPTAIQGYDIHTPQSLNMSANNDVDSRMASSPEDSDHDLATPAARTTHPTATILSPPDSQYRIQANMPISAPGLAGANANGKRPIQTISNGTEDDGHNLAAATTGKARQEFPPQTHAPSGYTWSRTEDEPGYAWMNKKALDESHRAWDQLVHREHMVKSEW